MIRTRLGPYEIIEEIGKGGAATVYRAYQPAMERHVAIKVIHQTVAHDSTAIERFRREARLIARLEHAHILPIYDFDGTHHPPYIVMRYLGSGSLKDILLQGSLPLAELGYLIPQIAGALDYAHQQGIIHRDIKPSNIMLDRDGNAFVTDFGIAHVTVGSRIAAGEVTGITQTGAVIGTPDYMAPEQAMGGYKIGPQTDVYALGVMLFQMMTGQMPYTGETPIALIFKHTQAPVPSAAALNPHLPPAVDEVILRALAKEPASRYASASELATALIEALGSTVASVPLSLRAAIENSPRLTLAGRPKKATLDTPSEQNKVVTVIYVDAAEYAAVVEEADGREAAHEAVNTLWNKVEQIATAQGGRVIAQTEDNLTALWGAEVSREDDPEQAIRAALAIQPTLRTLGRAFLPQEGSLDEPLPLRIGINTGVALLSPAPLLAPIRKIVNPVLAPGAGGITPTIASANSLDSAAAGFRPTAAPVGLIASGATVSLASRLAQNAEGTILISHDTFRHVLGVFDIEPDDPIRVRGRKDKLPVYRVTAAKASSFRKSIRGVEGVETKLVGREAELKQLQEAFFAALQDQETQVVTITGAAGLGKSRLLEEFDTWAELRPEKFWFFQGRATSAMTSRPYALLRDILSYRFEIYDSDTPALVCQKIEQGLADLISLDSPEMAHLIGYLAGFDFSDSPYIKGILNDPQQLTGLARRAFIRLFTGLGKQGPVVVQLEDLHWADDASLDLLMELVNEQPDLSLLLVCVARPLLYERRPTWGRGQAFHTQLELHPLSKRESRTLAREILQKMAEIPKVLSDLIVERAEGNPYYIEELIKMLIEERVIHKGEKGWSLQEERLANLPVPPTLVGLLQARLDSLLYLERIALQRAAVIGRIFWDSAVAGLEAADGIELGNVETILKTLAEREFIYRREITAFAGSQEYIFAQGMLRHVVYDNLVKRQQRLYHAEIAEWLQHAGGDRAEEYTALVAEHYEKAGEDKKAAQFLTRAGQRAFRVSAFEAALEFYRRALAILSPQTIEQKFPSSKEEAADKQLNCATVLLKMGEIELELSHYPEAQGHLEASLTLARQVGNRAGVAHALFNLSQVAVDQGDFTLGHLHLAESLPLARALNDPVILAWVLYGLGDLAWRQGAFVAAIPYLEESLAHARAARDSVQILYALNRLGAVSASLKQQGEARQRYEEGRALALQIGNRERLSVFLNNLGEMSRLEGNYAEAWEYYNQSLALDREMGQRDFEALGLLNLSLVSLKLGDTVTAKRYAQESLRLALAIGVMPSAIITLIAFAELRIHTGDISGALALLGLAAHHPATDANTQEEVERVLNELNLDPQTVEAGLAQGRALIFEKVAKELLGD